MFTWAFAKKLFDGFTIMRWTDFIRPIEFMQIEKSASQSVLTYIIGKEYEEEKRKTDPDFNLDWNFIVASNIYGLLCKIATSDIKSTVSKSMKTDPEFLPKLKNYVVGVYFDGDKCRYTANDVIGKKNFEKYIEQANNRMAIDCEHKVEYDVCYLAHKFATKKEFDCIKGLNKSCSDYERVEQDLELANITKNVGEQELNKIVHELANSTTNIARFYSYFEKLRPQIRWSQTCRIPQTTVLGHSMYVAMLTYFAIQELEIDKNDKEHVLVDSFYVALFHDLPESLTRDIISPIKNNVGNLKDLLEKYEYEEVNDKMLKYIENSPWLKDFTRLLGYHDGVFDPLRNDNYILGELIKKMDCLAAFMEAKMSVEMGINSNELQKGIKSMTERLQDNEFSYTCDKFAVKNKLSFNDFLASIPQYNEGVAQS